MFFVLQKFQDHIILKFCRGVKQEDVVELTSLLDSLAQLEHATALTDGNDEMQEIKTDPDSIIFGEDEIAELGNVDFSQTPKSKK